MKVDESSPTGRSILALVLFMLSLVWGLLGSGWLLLGLGYLLGGSAGDNPPSHHALLTEELGSLLALGIGALWPIGGLVFAIYLGLSGKWRPRRRRDLLALAGSLALVLVVLGLLVLLWWRSTPS